MELYRIQHNDTTFGMWNTLSPEGKPLVTYLTNEAMATLPMPYNPVYGTHGRRWYSSTNNLDDLYSWFNAEDIAELIHLGFSVYRIEASETMELAAGEIIFTRESVTTVENITAQFMLQPA